MLEYFYRPDNDSYYFCKKTIADNIYALGYNAKDDFIATVFGNQNKFKQVDKMNDITYQKIIDFVFTNFQRYTDQTNLLCKIIGVIQ